MPPLLVLDFDGTLALADVGDVLCDRFADPSWREWARRWRRGELDLPQAQVHMWSTVRADAATLRAAAAEVGAFRPGAEALFEAAREGALELVIASGGFDLYIEPLLGARMEHVAAAYYNRLEPGPEGARPRFPHAELARPPYAIDKAAVLARHRRPGQRVAFAGDGSSDRSVIGADAELFVVRGSLLERACNDAGAPHVSFDDFDTVARALLE